MARSATTLPGTAGNDELLGTGAAETFLASLGQDTLDGGGGDDWYVLPAALRASLYLQPGDPALYNGLVWKFDAEGYYLGLDLLARFRHVRGAAGDDVLFLDGQDSTVDGGAGHDLLDGGAGRDTLAFAGEAARGARVNLAVNFALDPWGGEDAVSNIEDVLGTDLADEVQGGAEGNWFRGAGGDDTLRGGLGDDTLDGGAGEDGLWGGLGDDLFVLRDVRDMVWEWAEEGFDRAEIHAPLWTLPEGSHVESLRLLAPGGALFGNALPNSLAAGEGPATLHGGGGDDSLLGSTGDDLLMGGPGNDRMEGGAGNDRYQVTGAGSRVAEEAGGGWDSVWVLAEAGWRVPEHVETAYLAGNARLLLGGPAAQRLVANPSLGSTLIAGSGDDELWGSPFADTLEGGAGNDILRSGGGADLLRGGPGDDAYDLRDARAVVAEEEGGGFDTAWVFADGWSSAPGVEVAYLGGAAVRLRGGAGGEALVANPLLGSWLEGLGGEDVLWGGAHSDTLEGGEGNDILRGQGGGVSGDLLAGGAGDDHAVVFDLQDRVLEQEGGGYDTAWVLADGWRVPVHVEVAYLAGEARLLLRGAGEGNLVAHPLLASTLVGGSGHDILWGGAGDDTLLGQGGDDQFIGGPGADTLRPGPGWFGHDAVFGFSGSWGEGDRLDLRGAVAAASDLSLALQAIPGGTRIVTAAGWLDLIGVAPGQLSAADFLL